MRLTAWEEERLQIFTAAELARRRRARGLLLNAPEAIALICDAMLEAARDGASYPETEAAGRDVLSPDDVLPDVAALVREIRIEVLMGDGTRLVVLLDPLGPPRADGPGAIRRDPDRTPEEEASDDDDRARLDLTVTSLSDRVIRVSSHHPFHRSNRRLVFDRAAADGFRLDVPAGSTVRWSPGETKLVRLVAYRGTTGRERGPA